MSWIRKLFGVGPSKPKHIGILVRGTLANAWAGVVQLQMCGLDSKVRGIGAAFGSEWDRLETEEGPGRSVSIRLLPPPWILVVPEDAYDRYRFEFEEVAGKPIDGRVEWRKVETMGHVAALPPALNIARAAIERVAELVQSWGPREEEMQPAAPQGTGRVSVGRCTACGRDLKVKERAVRPVMNLTCKCGSKNKIETASEPSPPTVGQAN